MSLISFIVDRVPRTISRVGGYTSSYEHSTDYIDLFSELRAEDELVVLARGLGLVRVITNLLHAYDAVGDNLIVIVGADDRENGWIGEGVYIVEGQKHRY